MPATPQLIGFATASREVTFPSPSETPVGRPFPAPLRYGFMRSGVISSSKSLRRFSRSPLVRTTAPAGVPSLFATSPTASTPFRAPERRPRGLQPAHGSSHATASFRPQVFSTSRRLAPPSDSRAYFIPQPRPGSSSVQGFLPSHSGSRLIAGPCPLVVAARPLAGDPAAMNALPDFEALFRVTKRSSESGF